MQYLPKGVTRWAQDAGRDNIVLPESDPLFPQLPCLAFGSLSPDRKGKATPPVPREVCEPLAARKIPPNPSLCACSRSQRSFRVRPLLLAGRCSLAAFDFFRRTERRWCKKGAALLLSAAGRGKAWKVCCTKAISQILTLLAFIPKEAGRFLFGSAKIGKEGIGIHQSFVWVNVCALSEATSVSEDRKCYWDPCWDFSAWVDTRTFLN